MGKRSIWIALVILSLVPNIAQAGFLGSLAGAALGDHEDDSAVGTVIRHPVLSGLAALSADVAAHQYLHDQGCAADAQHRWFCPGIPGRHILGIEAKDLYLARSTHGHALAKNLEAAGEPPRNGCDPHHIVPWRDKRGWAVEYTSKARAILERCGINLDDASNGIWLPKNPDAECEGAWHPRLHNRTYYKNIYRNLRDAMGSLASYDEACRNVKKTLARIKEGLRDKSYEGVRSPLEAP